MIAREKGYTVADLRVIGELPENQDKRFELLFAVGRRAAARIHEALPPLINTALQGGEGAQTEPV